MDYFPQQCFHIFIALKVANTIYLTLESENKNSDVFFSQNNTNKQKCTMHKNGKVNKSNTQLGHQNSYFGKFCGPHFYQQGSRFPGNTSYSSYNNYHYQNGKTNINRPRRSNACVNCGRFGHYPRECCQPRLSRHKFGD